MRYVSAALQPDPLEPMLQKLRNHHVLARGEHFLTCWRSLAPKASFAQMTPEELDTECQKVRDVDYRIRALETALRGLRVERRKTNRRLADVLIRFASSVRGSAGFGEDCPFYRALGFVTISENRSGRPRKPKPTQTGGGGKTGRTPKS